MLKYTNYDVHLTKISHGGMSNSVGAACGVLFFDIGLSPQPLSVELLEITFPVKLQIQKNF